MPRTDYELVAEPRPNMAEIDRILDYIIEHPEEWDQKSWTDESACGTTYCFAGHAVVAAGYVFKGGWLYSPDGGKALSTSQMAREVLGLTGYEAHELFIGTIYGRDEETLDRVKVQVEKIRYRAKLQDEAFNRLAQEFIDAAGLDTIDLEHCPDSPQFTQGRRGGEQS